jgi:hypothetical protein
MRNIGLLFAVAVALGGAHLRALAGGPDAAPFDGRWNVTLTCPPHNEDDDAKGYVHRFPAEVKAGEFRGTHATEGQPGWHLLTGTIAADGTANLKLEGIVNNPDYAINNAFRGKPYTYRVRARFESSVGTGQRIGKRKCDFQFNRQ